MHYLKVARFLFFHLFSLLLAVSTLQAQDFVFEFKNPAFGGDTFNYQWLLNSAQSQNTLTEESEGRPDDPLDDFQQSLNRQILSQLSRQIVVNQFGENGLQEGQYQVGTFNIDVSPTPDGVRISIIDTATGDETSVVVPFY
ncbi:MAG: curli production assembly/transport component CsgF [Candidatus Cyclobacteriaceae bacterium M3_2C_046]